MTKTPSTILVLDGDQRSALAVTRSLGREGMRVVVGSDQKTSLSGCSRFCNKSVKYASPFSDSELFVKNVIELITKHEVDVLMPMTDISTYYILKQEQMLRSVSSLPLPSFYQYQTASDKIEMVNIAKELGIPAPKSITVVNPTDWSPPPDLSFPCVLKPRSSLVDTGYSLIKCGVRIVHSQEELLYTINRYPAFKFPFMVQEHLRGEGLGIFALFDHGKPIVVFAHRRLREKPPWGGVSVLSESVEPDPEAKAYALALLSHLNWHGVAMVEFKIDHRTNQPKLMEINARFWGTLQLSIYAGVNFPRLLLDISKGIRVPPISDYLKVRMRWLLGDIDSMYLLTKSKIASKNSLLDIKYSSEIISFLKSFLPPVKYQVFCKNDIKPFLTEVRQYIKNLI